MPPVVSSFEVACRPAPVCLFVGHPHPGRQAAARGCLRYYFGVFSDPEVLCGSFGFYRAWDTTLAQNEQRKTRPLTMPVLAIGGAASWGEPVGDAMKPVADDVQSLVIAGAGHLGRRAGSRGAAGRADRVPGPHRDRR